MLTVEEALTRCLTAARAPRAERIRVTQAAGRILATQLRAPRQLPPWDNSAMDGYAVVASDTQPGEGQGPAVAQPDCDAPTHAHTDGAQTPTGSATDLVVLETIPAGGVGQHRVVSGCCARIMTGAPVPAGADAVVMREQVRVLPRESRESHDPAECVRISGTAAVGQHIRRAGEETAVGDLVLEAGTILGPGHLGLLSSLGLAEVQVTVRPRVAVVGTGDELVPPGQPLGPGQIHASNTAALCAWIQAAGGVALDCGIAPDTLTGTRQAFQRALDLGCDLLLSTGGVSVGDFDFVKEAMADVGATMDFWKVAVKPGKPLAFGSIGGVPAFGLPGNPVSCQVEFLQFVRPVIRLCLGDPHPFLPVVDAILDDGFAKRPGRAELVRVVLRIDAHGALHASTTGGQGSGQSSSMAQAHGLAMLAADGRGAPAGQTVAVQVYSWDFMLRADAGYRWAGKPA